jgi:hypothetical protein
MGFYTDSLDGVAHMPFTGSTFYCHACATRLGLLHGLHPASTAPSTYQQDKALKHTRPAVLSTGIHSVLNSGSTAEYDSLDRAAYDHGFLEIEKSGVRSLIVQTTAPFGTVYRGAIPAEAADSFRRVLSTDIGRAHGYPESSTSYSGAVCANCSISLTS